VPAACPTPPASSRLTASIDRVRARGLDHIVLLVESVDKSLAWYAAVLGAEPDRVDEWRRGEASFPSLRLNADTVIDLVEEERTGENVKHFCLVVEDADLHQLARSGQVEVVEGPDQRWGARGTGTVLYVRDPDDNVVELRTYP
jgi:catechol 2,3-dioxygenase-like lactoylglutathione lyase family enzyme